jgi:hypothetical protein
MAANATWAIESPAINHPAFSEIEHMTPAKVALDSNELSGSGLPALSVTATLSGAYSKWWGS